MRRKAVQTLHEILEGPDWLLVGFSKDWTQLIFLETTREILADAAFIDGRTPLSRTEQIAEVDLADIFRAMQTQAPRRRLIIHTGFCGSTLLTHLLQSGANCLTYREPDALVALSSERGSSRDGDEAWRRLVDIAARQFSKGWDGEFGVIKPSNWTLNLVGDLCLTAAGTRAVFLTMDARSFLIAVLRGGRERLDFMLKLMSFLQRDFAEARAFVSLLESNRHLSATQRTLRLILMGLALQRAEHERVMACMPENTWLGLSYAELMDDPAGALARVRGVLDLSPRAGDEHAAIKNVLRHYSKSPSTMFDRDGYARADEWIKDQLGAEINGALDWAEKELNLV